MTDQELPEVALEPKSIIQLVIPSDPSYVLESPAEVREKMTELANTYGGLGEDSDESGLLTLSGIELHTRPEVSPEPFEYLIHPKLIGFIKSVHPAYWRDQLRLAAQANEEWRQAETGEEGVAISSGLPDPVRQMLEGMGLRIAEGAGKVMTAEEFAEEGGPETECCCTHPAKDHEMGETLGQCNECGCARFHTHP